MSDVVIRPLVPQDRAAWERLWQGYLTFYEQELAPEVSDDLFARLLGEGRHSAFVAQTRNALVGFVHYLPHDSTWSVHPTCYLEDLFVDENVRGGGVGAKLIQAVYDEADRQGWGNVYWQTHNHNSRARRLYDHVGTLSDFVRYDRPKAK